MRRKWLTLKAQSTSLMIKDIVKNSAKSITIESSLSRVWQHVQNPDGSFAIISAHLRPLSKAENQERHEELQSWVRDLGYGYIELDSGYSSFGEEGEGEALVEEQSLMIPGIGKGEAVKIAQEYSQESILFKQGKDFVLLGTRKGVGVGNVLDSFKTGEDSLTFDAEAVENVFSALSSGSDKFAFVAERAVRDFPTRMAQRRSEMIGENWLLLIDNT